MTDQPPRPSGRAPSTTLPETRMNSLEELLEETVSPLGPEAGSEQRAIKQGDLLRWEDHHHSAPWQTFGVIVTADCDLKHGKHRGRVSYVPAFTTKDFFWHIWRPHLFEGRLIQQKTTLASRINSWLLKEQKVVEALDGELIFDWLKRSGPSDLIDEMGVVDQGQRNGLLNIILPTYSAHHLLSSIDPNYVLFNECFMHFFPKASESPNGQLEMFQRFVREIPGDIFHLPCNKAVLDDHLFVMLRHISQCAQAEIASSPDDLREGRAKIRVVGRVGAPYRYAITQNLARVFSDIGLPERYETSRKETAAKFFLSRSTS